MTHSDSVEALLGSEAASHLLVLDHFRGAFDGYVIEFQPNERYGELLISDLPEGMRIYWSELIQRAYLAAALSLIRTDRWVGAMLTAHQAENALSFASAWRALLEAAADTDDALRNIALSLAEAAKIIRTALDGELDRVVAAPETENALLHFTHARRLEKGEDAPESHRAKTARAYLDSLAGTRYAVVHECYSLLCGMTHPAAQSLAPFLMMDSAGEQLVINSGQDRQIIKHLCEEMSEVWQPLLSLGVNSPILILKTLNLFENPLVQCESVESIDLDAMPAWAKVQQAFREAVLPWEQDPEA